MTLDDVITKTNLPMQFTYQGLSWLAVGVGRYDQEGFNLVPTGSSIDNSEMYFEQGTPVNPYIATYLKPTTKGYTNLYVRYKPMLPAQKPGTTPSGQGAGPSTTQPSVGMNLNQVLSSTGLPSQFIYGGLTWQAASVGSYTPASNQFTDIGASVNGNELYYKQGTPTNPYKTLYFQTVIQGNQHVYVMYEPTN